MLKKGRKMELIDAVDENNQLTGQICDKKEIHKKEFMKSFFDE